jgi:hypothetical protein
MSLQTDITNFHNKLEALKQNIENGLQPVENIFHELHAEFTKIKDGIEAEFTSIEADIGSDFGKALTGPTGSAGPIGPVGPTGPTGPNDAGIAGEAAPSTEYPGSAAPTGTTETPAA